MPGYATGEMGVHSAAADDPANDLYQLSPAVDLRLVLLAKDELGYRNLVKLVTAAHLEGHYYKPRIDKEILAANKTGLIALSGCLARRYMPARSENA